MNQMPRVPASHGRLRLVRNGFVWTGDQFGIGKVTDGRDGMGDVRLFHSISHSESATYPLRELRRWLLYPQTRAYVRDADTGATGPPRWRMGRVVGYDVHRDSGRVEYEVQLPNHDTEWLDERMLEVRTLTPNPDPTEALAWGAPETQFFHDRRMPAVHALMESRAAAQGLTGLLSAAIELLPHQLAVTRRVLEDPVQRYLLADEVGLGKTIEAGIVIRQCLLDQRAARLLVLTPPALLGQWQEELRLKFAVEDFPGAVTVLPFDALASLEPGGYDLVVIDEAHQVLAATPLGSGRFARLQDLARASPRLLLLSATPVIGHEEATLALLHLLDPVAHPLSDVEGFRAKVARRQEYGRLLLLLNRNPPPFLRRQLAGDLRAAFPADEFVLAQAERLIAPEGTEEAIAGALRALRRHIAETYRLHHRVVRTRRRDLADGTLLPRVSLLVAPDPDGDPRTAGLVDLLEDWRYQAAVSLSEESTDDAEATLAARYVRLVDALGQGSARLGQEATRQAAEVARGGLDTFPDDRLILGELAARAAERSPADEGYAETVAAATWLALRSSETLRARGRAVVFVTSTEAATEIAAALQGRHALAAVERVLVGDTSEQVHAAVQRFTAADGPAAIVCDRSGEEGLNLHVAHAIVHADLPLSPARLEQRLGRLDRLGRREPRILHRFVLPSDEPLTPWHAWLALLRDVFRLFDESISEVQFQLAEVEREVARALLRGGADGLRCLTEPIRRRLAEERQRLDEQYALDQLVEEETDGGADAPLLRQREERATEALARGLSIWLHDALQLRMARDAGGAEAVRCVWGRRTLIPEEPWRPLLASGLDRPLTFSRAAAVRRPNLRLVRPGFPFVDAVECFLRWDDRGAAFATWRLDPARPAEPGFEWLGFRLCYVVEADHEVAGHVLAAQGFGEGQWSAANLSRRADALLPPWLEVRHVDAALVEVNDPVLLKQLTRPYDHRPNPSGVRDYNLGSRWDALTSLIAEDDFAALCRRVRARSEELLRESDAFRTGVSRAAARARAVMDERTARLRRRAEAIGREGGRVDPAIAIEIAANEAIVAAVERPAVRLDAIGFFVLAGYPPPSGV